MSDTCMFAVLDRHMLPGWHPAAATTGMRTSQPRCIQSHHTSMTPLPMLLSRCLYSVPIHSTLRLIRATRQIHRIRRPPFAPTSRTRRPNTRPSHKDCALDQKRLGRSYSTTKKQENRPAWTLATSSLAQRLTSRVRLTVHIRRGSIPPVTRCRRKDPIYLPDRMVAQCCRLSGRLPLSPPRPGLRPAPDSRSR